MHFCDQVGSSVMSCLCDQFGLSTIQHFCDQFQVAPETGMPACPRRHMIMNKILACVAVSTSQDGFQMATLVFHGGAPSLQKTAWPSTRARNACQRFHHVNEMHMYTTAPSLNEMCMHTCIKLLDILVSKITATDHWAEIPWLRFHGTSKY